MPTVQRAGSSNGGRSTCAVSLRQGVYWIGRVGSSADIDKYQLDDGSLTTSIASDSVMSMEKTADRNFLVFAGSSRLQTLDTRNDAIHNSGYFATSVSVCDDGTIISAFLDFFYGSRLARHNVDFAGNIETSAQVSIGLFSVIACSPGSTFVVVVSSAELRSYAVSSLTVVDTLPTAGATFAIAFNPTTSDVYLLHYNGKLSVYAFNSDGTFGVSKASTDIGFVHTSNAGTSVLEFAYGKLFVHAADQLLTYDAALNLKSNQTIVTGLKTSICVSEGTKGCVCWARLSS
jgi:hypothetical protein